MPSAADRTRCVVARPANAWSGLLQIQIAIAVEILLTTPDLRRSGCAGCALGERPPDGQLRRFGTRPQAARGLRRSPESLGTPRDILRGNRSLANRITSTWRTKLRHWTRQIRLDSRNTDPARIELAQTDLESDPQIPQQRNPCFCVVQFNVGFSARSLPRGSPVGSQNWPVSNSRPTIQSPKEPWEMRFFDTVEPNCCSAGNTRD